MKKNATRAAVLERIVPSVLMFSMILTSFGSIAIADETVVQNVEPVPTEEVAPVEEVADTPAVIEENTSEDTDTSEDEVSDTEEENVELIPVPTEIEEVVDEQTGEDPSALTLDIVQMVAEDLIAPLAIQLQNTDTTVVVRETSMQGWSEANTVSGDVSYVAEAGAPIGTGAIRLTTAADNQDRAAVSRNENVALANVTALGYSTYRGAGFIPEGNAAYRVRIDGDGDLSTTNDIATLVHEPYWQNGGSADPAPIQQGVWQEWNVFNGIFWASIPGGNAVPGLTNGAGGPPFYTINDVLAARPNAKVIGISVGIGSYNNNYDVLVDEVVFGANYGSSIDTVTYDFEPAAPDTTAPAIPTGLAWTGSDSTNVPNNGTTNQYTGTASWNANSETDFSHYIYKYWNDIPSSQYKDEATSYQVTNNGVSNTSYFGAFNQGEGVHHFCVAAVDTTGNQSACSAVFTITYSTVLDVPTHLSPADSAIQNVNDFYFDWTSVPGAVEYEFQSSQNPATDGSGVLTTGVWNNKANGGPDQVMLATSTIHSYGATGTWYWQVRAIDVNGNKSAWSQTWAITLDVTAPAAPTHISPANESTVTTSTFLFDWSDVTDATAVVYDWIGSLSQTLNPDGSLAAVLAAHNGLTDSSVNSPNTPDNTYFWQVRARDAAGNASAWTMPWKVTVDTTTPPAPAPVSVIIEPTDGEVASGTTDLLAFYADQNGDNNDALQWAVRAGTCAASTNTVFGNVDGKNTPFTWDGTNFQSSIDTTSVANGSYCFVFNPTEDAGSTNQRLTRTFTIQNDAPVDPVDPVITSETVTVTPADMEGWDIANYDETDFSDDASPTVLGTKGVFVTGISAPPLGVGSFEQTIGSNGNEADRIRTSEYNGVLLEDIKQLSYSTYVQNFVSGQATYLQLRIDWDNDGDMDDAIFFEPVYQNGTYGMQPGASSIPNQGDVVEGAWQTWDASAGGWWSNADGAGGPPLHTLESYIAAHPGAKLVSDNAAIRLQTGFGAGAWDNFVGNMDEFVIRVDNGVTDATTVYDFEPNEVVVTEPVVENNESNGNSSSRSASRRSSGGGQVLGASTSDGSSTGGQVLGASCPLITAYMREGMENDAEQVMSLQGFLNGELGLSLGMTGVMDAVTVLGVKMFQVKYAADVLLPWGLTAETPTGYVYKTTMWKINDIACPDLEVAMPQVP